ncbi:phosphopentomutase [Kineothrix alysoides]|uniref:Phosphopentomutase n=1 Tax=Kineothrix alysoides TaxID=1469948 RepID=A0A4R1R3S9_9FIRM|nr:phosphopentomutase [Kineothrix alysoides]TCL60116.1 phosphopentomutase [Kineothrix alysoides]
MGRFIIIVLDGFGIGQTDDVLEVRPSDNGANTLKSILSKFPDLKLRNLEKLGLMNAYGESSECMHMQKDVTYGKASLMHYGADTFFGHQEIMGTLPQKPFAEPFGNKINIIKDKLIHSGYMVETIRVNKQSYLMINDCVTAADNMECDSGQAFNVTASLDYISFDEVVKIGKLVRSIATVPRVIAFGGRDITKRQLMESAVEKGCFVGIDAPKSGVYDNDYHCIHLGYGVDPKLQIQTILSDAHIPVFMVGKAADVIQNKKGTSISLVPTDQVLEQTLNIVKQNKNMFVCANVQETDLSGHSQDVQRYKEVLLMADKGIGEIRNNLEKEDVMIVMADHGNDPLIGHSKHTREKVPLLIYSPNKTGFIGERKSLSDVAATAAKYFKVPSPQNGKAILDIF